MAAVARRLVVLHGYTGSSRQMLDLPLMALKPALERRGFVLEVWLRRSGSSWARHRPARDGLGPQRAHSRVPRGTRCILPSAVRR
jgi:hypothetical protein